MTLLSLASISILASISAAQEILIFAQSVGDGSVMPIDVDSQATVGELAKLFLSQPSCTMRFIAPNQLTISSAGQELTDYDQTLADAGIGAEQSVEFQRPSVPIKVSLKVTMPDGESVHVPGDLTVDVPVGHPNVFQLLSSEITEYLQGQGVTGFDPDIIYGFATPNGSDSSQLLDNYQPLISLLQTADRYYHGGDYMVREGLSTMFVSNEWLMHFGMDRFPELFLEAPHVDITDHGLGALKEIGGPMALYQLVGDYTANCFYPPHWLGGPHTRIVSTQQQMTCRVPDPESSIVSAAIEPLEIPSYSLIFGVEQSRRLV